MLNAIVLQTFWFAPWQRLLAAFIMAWWLPGLLLVRIIQPPDADLPTALILSVGLGLGWMMSIALFVTYMPGPILPPVLKVVYFSGALLLGVLSIWVQPLKVGSHSGQWHRIFWARVVAVPTKVWLSLLVLFGLALVLRLPGIGYHELHVDEVSVLRAARRAIEGVPGVLAEHTKGPGEILVSVVGYAMLGNIDELTGRLPFALMSIGSVLGLALLGRRIHSNMIGFLAGILLVLNGFALGLSRIAQYQGGMLLYTVLAAYAGWEFSQWGKSRWLLLCIAFATFGIVLHYEGALILPLLVALSWFGWQKSNQKGHVAKSALAAVLAGTILLAIAYIPLLLNESFGRTQDYLSNRLGDLTNFNFAFFVEMGTFYNSIYFFVGSLLLILLGIGYGLQRRARRADTILLILWFLPNFVLYFFVMQFPGTHFYTMAPAWSLLAAVGLAMLIGTWKSMPLRWATTIVVVGWMAISANYLRLIFFQQEPEYLINYRDVRSKLYWAPYGENIPEKPRFGFPILEGWKAAGLLAEWGYLGESYASNERSRHLRRWYLESISRRNLQDLPETVFVARHLQDRNFAFDEDFVEREYQKVGDIRVRGEPRIELWQRNPLPVPYVSYDVESFEDAFDDTIPPLTQGRTGLVVPQSAIVDVELSSEILLDAAWLSKQTIAGGAPLHVTLVWQVRQRLQNNYKLFVHILDQAGELRTQWDGYPGLNTTATTAWVEDEPFIDHVFVPIPTELAGEEVRVVAGLYDESTGERVGIGAVEVGTISVK